MKLNFDNIDSAPFWARFLLAVISIPLVILSMILTVIFIGVYHSLRFSSETVYFITSKLSLFPIVFSVSILLYLIIKIFYKNEKFMQKLALIGVFIGLFFGTLSLMYFNKFTLDGVYTYTAFSENYYSFNDMLSFNAKEGSDGTLNISFIAEDGKEFTYTGGKFEVTSYTSANIDEIYKEDPTKEYLLDIAKIMKKGNIPFIISNRQELEEDIEYEYWLDILDEILLIYKEN